MKRLLVGIVVLALLAVGVTTAIGQGNGGTVGSAATGTKSFEVRIKEKSLGLNCVASKPAKCFRQKPRPANLFAGNGKVYDGSTHVGTAGFTGITAKVKKPSLEVFLATLSFNNNVDSISVMGPSRDEGDVSLPYSIVGGTGIYAGARGTVQDKEVKSPVKGEFRVQLDMTFIP